jgi:hypothetical protein
VTEGRKITLSVCGSRDTNTPFACLFSGGASWWHNEPWIVV